MERRTAALTVEVDEGGLMAIDPSEPDTDARIAGTKYRVNPLLADRVNRLIADAPPELQGDLQHAITSGYRTHEQQLKAYLHHLAGGGLAAKPGHSWHERDHGMAVDWNNVTPRAWAYLKDHAIDYKLGFPLGSRDPFHMQPVETFSGAKKGLSADKTDKPPEPKVDLPDVKVTAAPVPPTPPRVQPPSPMPDTSLSQLRQIVTRPAPLTAPPAHRPLPAPHSAPHAANLASTFASGLRRILASR